MSHTPSPLYCWFDTEYTDLDLSRAQILEVALVVTKTNLVPLSAKPGSIPNTRLRPEGYSACVKPPPSGEISEHVRSHYQPLLQRCADEGLSIREVDGHLAAYLDALTLKPGTNLDRRDRPILAGNTVHADLFLAKRFLPEFTKRISYRILDVTAFKVEWQYHHRGEKFSKQEDSGEVAAYYPGEEPVSGHRHDAYYDVQASIAELAYYRSKLKMS